MQGTHSTRAESAASAVALAPPFPANIATESQAIKDRVDQLR